MGCSEKKKRKQKNSNRDNSFSKYKTMSWAIPGFPIENASLVAKVCIDNQLYGR